MWWVLDSCYFRDFDLEHDSPLLKDEMSSGRARKERSHKKLTLSKHYGVRAICPIPRQFEALIRDVES